MTAQDIATRILHRISLGLADPDESDSAHNLRRNMYAVEQLDRHYSQTIVCADEDEATRIAALLTADDLRAAKTYKDAP